MKNLKNQKFYWTKETPHHVTVLGLNYSLNCIGNFLLAAISIINFYCKSLSKLQLILVICIDYFNCCRRREGGVRSYCIIIIAEALVNPPSFEINFRIPIKVCTLQLCFEVCSICTLISVRERTYINIIIQIYSIKRTDFEEFQLQMIQQFFI